MTTETLPIEDELRALFAEIAAPAAPATWRVAEPVAPRRRTPERTRWVHLPAPRRVLAVAVLAALVVVGGLAYARKTTAPAPNLVSAITVTVDAAGAALDCRLPISALSSDHTTGFIVMASGKPSFDPVRTSGTTYVAALGRWVDVLPQMVAPDGLSYVTQDNTPQRTVIRVVDAHDTRTLLTKDTSPTSSHPSVFAYTIAGILILDPGLGAPDNLNWQLMDPVTGFVRPFPHPGPVIPPGQGGTGYLRAGNALWITTYNPDTNVSAVARYDLATGVQVVWYAGKPDGLGNAQVVGADSLGNPIIQVSSSDLFHTAPDQRAGIGVRTLLMTAPHNSKVLNQGRVGSPGVAGDLSSESVTDGDKIWLAADDGAIWLYRPSEGIVQVAKVTTSSQGAPGVAISGPCR